MWTECSVKQHPCAFLLWMRWVNIIVCRSLIYYEHVLFHWSVWLSTFQPFTSCCIGSAGHRTTTTTTTSPTLPNPSHSPSEMAFAAHAGPPTLARSQSFPASFAAAAAGRPGLSRDSLVHTIPAGLQDTAWGSPSSLGGLLASVFICHEALQPAQARALFTAGINETSTAFIMQKFTSPTKKKQAFKNVYLCFTWQVPIMFLYSKLMVNLQKSTVN